MRAMEGGWWSTALGMAVLVFFPAQLPFGVQDGLQKPVVQEKGPTQLCWEQFQYFFGTHISAPTTACLHEIGDAHELI